MKAKWIVVLSIVLLGILCLLSQPIRQRIKTGSSVGHKCGSSTQDQIPMSLAADLKDPVTPISSQSNSNWWTIVSSAQDTHQSVFEECQSFFDTDLKTIGANSMTRPGFLAGWIDRFTKEGAESRTVDILVGRRDSQYGSLPIYSNIVQYTDAEVQEGKARNAAARLAVLHYFITSPRRGSPYAQIEIMRLFMRWWYGGAYSELTDDEVIGFYEFVAKDRTRHPLVREYAAASLPAKRRPDMTKLMLNILQDNTIGNEHQHGPIIERACSYLINGERLDILQSVLTDQITPIPPWKAKLIRHAAGLPFEESEKEAAKSKEVEISL